MAISTANFKNGMCIEYNGKPNIILEFQHVKPGKGAAFVRTKLRDVNTGRVVEYTFNAGTKFEAIHVEKKTVQYLYQDGDDYVMMDTTSYEQFTIPNDILSDSAKWLKENDECQLMYAGGKLVSCEPQMFVELEVTETEPGFKGDTVQGGTKPATLETGAVVNLPMYINQGDKVQIDTRDGRFVKRV